MTSDQLNAVQQELEQYLVEQVERGNEYFKSKYIAQELDLTSKTVGTNLGILQERTDEITIESWSGGSSGTTWRVTRADDPSDSEAAPAQEERSSGVVTAAPLDD